MQNTEQGIHIDKTVLNLDNQISIVTRRLTSNTNIRIDVNIFIEKTLLHTCDNTINYVENKDLLHKFDWSFGLCSSYSRWNKKFSIVLQLNSVLVLTQMVNTQGPL